MTRNSLGAGDGALLGLIVEGQVVALGALLVCRWSFLLDHVFHYYFLPFSAQYSAVDSVLVVGNFFAFSKMFYSKHT